MNQYDQRLLFLSLRMKHVMSKMRANKREIQAGALRFRLPEVEAVCRHCLEILTTEKSIFENFAQFTSGFLTTVVYDEG